MGKKNGHHKFKCFYSSLSVAKLYFSWEENIKKGKDNTVVLYWTIVLSTKVFFDMTSVQYTNFFTMSVNQEIFI